MNFSVNYFFTTESDMNFQKTPDKLCFGPLHHINFSLKYIGALVLSIVFCAQNVWHPIRKLTIRKSNTAHFLLMCSQSCRQTQIISWKWDTITFHPLISYWIASLVIGD